MFLNLVRINFDEETYVSYNARTKYGKCWQKNILLALVYFFMKLKTAFTQFKNSKFLLENLNLKNFVNWQFTNMFSETNFHKINQNSWNSQDVIPSRKYTVYFLLKITFSPL